MILSIVIPSDEFDCMNEGSTYYIWLNGAFLNKHDINIDPLSHGLHYGTGAFEGIRVYNKKIFKLEEHIIRLFSSAKILLMDIPFVAEHIYQACLEMVELNKIDNGYLRPLIFLDDKSMAIGGENDTNVMIAYIPRITDYHKNFADKKSLRLKISSLIRPPAESFPYKAKVSGLYVLNHLAKKRAIMNQYDDALMLDYRGYISEATTSNFFMVRSGELHTPKTECCLNGITRQVVIELARKNNIHVAERDIEALEIKDSDEAFLTGTASEITAIHSINEHVYQANPISKMLYEQFYQLTQS